MQQHGLLMILAAVVMLVGLQLVALGLIGELEVWQYFNPSERKPYSVSAVVETRSTPGCYSTSPQGGGNGMLTV